MRLAKQYSARDVIQCRDHMFAPVSAGLTATVARLQDTGNLRAALVVRHLFLDH